MRALFLGLVFLFFSLGTASANDIMAERSIVTKLCAELVVGEDEKEFWSVRLSEVPSWYLTKIGGSYQAIKKNAVSALGEMQKHCARERVGYDLGVKTTSSGRGVKFFGGKLKGEDLTVLADFEKEMTAIYQQRQSKFKSGWAPKGYFSIYYQFSSSAVKNLYVHKEQSIAQVAEFLLGYNANLLAGLEAQSVLFSEYRGDDDRVFELKNLKEKDLLSCQGAQLASAHSIFFEPKFGDFEHAGKNLTAYLLSQRILSFYRELGGGGEGLTESELEKVIWSGRSRLSDTDKLKQDVISSCRDAHKQDTNISSVLRQLYPPLREAPK